MRLKVLAILMLCAPSAFAQTEAYWRTALHDLYRYDMAFDACKEVTPSAAEMLSLEAAIAYVEEKTGLEEDELDERPKLRNSASNGRTRSPACRPCRPIIAELPTARREVRPRTQQFPAESARTGSTAQAGRSRTRRA